MNKHILFVMDHLANPGKYTQEELEAADADADAAASAAVAAAAALPASLNNCCGSLLRFDFDDD